METFKLPLGRAQDLLWPEPQCVVFAYVLDGYVYGVRRTVTEHETSEYLEREAAKLRRRRRLDKSHMKPDN